MINPEILSIFKDNKIQNSDGITFLLSVYYSLNPTYIPQSLKVKLEASGIIKLINGTYQLEMPLFENQITDDRWDWVKEDYCSMFKRIGKPMFLKESLSRMKKLFAENPDIRKDEVIRATELYFSETSPTYVRQPHYFIEKGMGKDKTQDILTWIERIREEEDEPESRLR